MASGKQEADATAQRPYGAEVTPGNDRHMLVPGCMHAQSGR
jgi:hypothetical protein